MFLALKPLVVVFIMGINVKTPTTAGILAFIVCWHFNINERDTFHAQLS